MNFNIKTFITVLCTFFLTNLFSQTTLPSVPDSVSYSLDTASRQLYATYHYIDTVNKEVITRTKPVKDATEQAKIIGSAYTQVIRNTANDCLVVKNELDNLGKTIKQANEYEKKFNVFVLDTTGISVFVDQRFKFIGQGFESVRFRLQTPKQKSKEDSIELPRFQYSFDGEKWSKADYVGNIIRLHNVKVGNEEYDLTLIATVQEKRIVFEDMNGWFKMIVR